MQQEATVGQKIKKWMSRLEDVKINCVIISHGKCKSSLNGGKEDFHSTVMFHKIRKTLREHHIVSSFRPVYF